MPPNTPVRQEVATTAGTQTMKALYCGLPNVKMSSLMNALDPSHGGRLVEGIVIRTDIGWYGVAVSIDGLDMIPCTVLTSTASNYFGAACCSLPVEGSRVLVRLSSSRHRHGVVVGVLPPADTFPLGDSSANPAVLTRYASMWEYESNASVGSSPAYISPLKDTKNLVKINANAGRPLDILPGAQACVNEQGVGWAVTATAATLKGDARAQVRVSCVDSQVRVVSGHFVHHHAGGSTQTYNDGGLLTEESGFTGYQAERMGLTNIGDVAFTEIPPDDDIRKGLKTSQQPVAPRMTAKKRLQSFIGYLGDLINIFVANPDPDVQVETENDPAYDQGLGHVHLDGSGLITVKTAGGISLQRTDRIPIPKRLRQPWDPEGDKVEDRTTLSPKPAFDFGSYPYGRAVQLRDVSAWRDRGAYWRLHNQSTAAGSLDFFLPEEQDLVTPVDQYDKTGNATETFSKYEKRKSFVNLEPDGSIILRDAWGSEIVMAGGNITITCAGQLQLRSGKSTVVLAGQDVVLKAHDSVDVTAEKHDVRVKADSKIEVVSTGAESGNGGILLQSRSPGPGSWSGSGESGSGSGIVLKAEDSGILVAADILDLSGKSAVNIETLGGSGQGTIALSSNSIEVNADSEIFLGAGGASAVLLDSSTALIAGPEVFVAGGSGLLLSTGDQAWEPLQYVTLTSGSPYDQFSGSISALQTLLDAEDWLAPFQPSSRPDIKFTFRNSEEYGTTKATEVQGATDFAVYQPSWAFMAQSGSVLLNGAAVDSWTEQSIDGGYPWPGAGARDTGYVQLEDESNVNTDDGIALIREDLTPTSGTLSPASFDEIETIQ